MHSKTMKVAISLPKQIFNQVEEIRHRLGLARSKAVLEALRLWLRQKEEERLEEKYVRGYERKPEQLAEAEPLFRAGLSSFTTERW